MDTTLHADAFRALCRSMQPMQEPNNRKEQSIDTTALEHNFGGPLSNLFQHPAQSMGAPVLPMSFTHLPHRNAISQEPFQFRSIAGQQGQHALNAMMNLGAPDQTLASGHHHPHTLMKFGAPEQGAAAERHFQQVSGPHGASHGGSIGGSAATVPIFDARGLFQGSAQILMDPNGQARSKLASKPAMNAVCGSTSEPPSVNVAAGAHANPNTHGHMSSTSAPTGAVPAGAAPFAAGQYHGSDDSSSLGVREPALKRRSCKFTPDGNGSGVLPSGAVPDDRSQDHDPTQSRVSEPQEEYGTLGSIASQKERRRQSAKKSRDKKAAYMKTLQSENTRMTSRINTLEQDFERLVLAVLKHDPVGGPLLVASVVPHAAASVPAVEAALEDSRRALLAANQQRLTSHGAGAEGHQARADQRLDSTDAAQQR